MLGVIEIAGAILGALGVLSILIIGVDQL
jgi:hypothetical protein